MRSLLLAVAVSSSSGLAGEVHNFYYDSTSLDKQRSDLLNREYSEVQPSIKLFSSEDCPAFLKESYPWEIDLGEGGFGVKLLSRLDISLDCKSAQALSVTDIEGEVFDQPMKLANVEASAVADNEDLELNLGVYVLGYEVHTTSLQGRSQLNYSDVRDFNVDRSDTYSGSIGPVPVEIKYGVEGKVSFQWNAVLGVFSSHIQSAPKVDTRAFVIGGISAASVLALELKGDLTLLEDELLSEGRVSLANQGGQPVVELSANMSNVLKALDGAVTGSVQLMDRTLYNEEIFAWDGIYSESSIFEIEEVLELPLGYLGENQL